MHDELICAACGLPNTPTQRFCGGCAAPLARRCAACGEENPAAYRFCGACGQPLAEPAEPARAEERRWTTVLFADLSGFTTFSERTDPEDIRSMVDECTSKMGEIIVRYGGFVERVVGDEIMALFGAPVAHEDDPERAVRAGLELQQCAVEEAEAFGRLPLRVGINSGEMMFAPVGPEGARQFTVMGDAVNVASRLTSVCPVGKVLVGEETFRATSRAIRYEAAEPLALKGKEEPVRAWIAVGAEAAPAPRPVSAAPMIGRNTEIDLLRRLFERVAAERKPHLVTIVGPPGIGKTRLTRELVAHAEARGARTLTGRSLPYGESTGFGAFAQQLKQFAGVFETDSVPEAREKLARALDGILADDAADDAEHLATMVGLGSGVATGDKAPLFLAARRFVEAIGRRRPVVMVFEDIHWSDASLFELIESLAARARETAVLLVTLARPELMDIRRGWGGGLTSYSALPLDPLSDAESVTLASLLMPHLATAELVDQLAETSGGNPLFLEELAATVGETTAEAVRTLPTNVKAIIAARLDGLPPAERQTILDASVVGKVFWRGALEQLGGTGPLGDVLDALEARDLVRRAPVSRLERDEEYVFKHMLIREVAYETLPRAARRQRHAAVAGFIEHAAGDRVAESASLLAHHWLQAGDDERAVGFLLRAAEYASGVWASGEAVKLYEQALELIPSADRERRRAAGLKRALAIVEAGDLTRGADELDVLLPDLEGRDRLEALAARASAAFWLVRAAEGKRFADELAKLADERDDDEFRTLSLGIKSLIAPLSGASRDAIEVGERALASWPAGKRNGERALVLGVVGLASYWLGDYDKAKDVAEAAWRTGQAANSIVGFLQTAPQLSMVLAGLGRHEEAIAHSEWTIAMSRDLELVPRWTSRGMNMYAGVLYEVFQDGPARQLNEEAVELSKRAAFPTATVQAGVDMLFADVRQGHVGRAERSWHVLWDQANELHGWHEWLVRGRMLQAKADLLVASGKPEEAFAASHASLEHARSYHRPKYELLALRSVADGLLGLGRAADAVASAREALRIAQRLGHPPSVWSCAATLARSLAATGDDDGASAAARTASESIERFAATLAPDRRATLLGAEPVRESLALGS